MLIYITEVFALLINWITCGPYLVILLTVDWSCLPAPISTENGTWMSYCRWSGTLKLYLQYSWLLCDIFLKRNTKDVLPDMPSYPYLQSSLSIFHSTKYCKINLLKAQFWSCHHRMENISTNPHSLQNKFLNRKDGQMYLLWHNIRRHEVSTVLENNTKVDSFLNLFFYYSWQTVQISFRCTPKWLDIYTPYTVAEMPIWKLAIPSTYPMLKKLLAQLTAQSWSWAPVQS